METFLSHCHAALKHCEDDGVRKMLLLSCNLFIDQNTHVSSMQIIGLPDE